MDVDVGTLMFDEDESLFHRHLSWQNYLLKEKKKKYVTNFSRPLYFRMKNVFSLINKDLKRTIIYQFEV